LGGVGGRVRHGGVGSLKMGRVLHQRVTRRVITPSIMLTSSVQDMLNLLD
jgi:hypothetical protein